MKNQFLALQGWTFDVLEAIKKDIKTDHLNKDHQFYKAHFGSRPQNRLTTEEIFSVYEKELFNGNEGLAEWVVNRWVFKHGDLYNHFAQRLEKINPNFDEIESLTEKQSEQVLEGASDQFGAIPTFLFALLNGVVFPEKVLAELKKAAEKEKKELAKSEALTLEEKGLSQQMQAQQREIAKLQDKIEGVLKRYEKDTLALKRQIKGLQKKIDELR